MSDCDRSHHARGWCRKHYLRWRVHGHTNVTRPVSVTGMVCVEDDCDGPVLARDRCQLHYNRLRERRRRRMGSVDEFALLDAWEGTG